MASSRRNYICVTESSEIKKYAAQYIHQIMELESPTDPFISITSIGLHCSGDEEFEELEWSDSW